jgi:hypothetical protein
MIDGESFDLLPSSGCQLQEDTPAVRPSLFTHYKARLLASSAELNNGVMAQSKACGRIAYRRIYLIGRSGNLEKQLMLLRRETTLLRCRLTKLEKQTELIAKFGECLKTAPRRRQSLPAHQWSISHNDISAAGKWSCWPW